MTSSILIAVLMLSFTFSQAFAQKGFQANRKGPFPDTVIQTCANIVTLQRPYMIGVRDQKEQMELRLTGIYTRGEVLYYRLEIGNHSALTFDVDQLRISIRDKKQVKRHAWQEVFMQPLLIAGDTSAIGPGEHRTWVVALQKEVLSPFQYLSVALLEHHGGRDLHLIIGYKKILHVKFVNEM